MSRSVDGVTNLPRINPIVTDNIDPFFVMTFISSSGSTREGTVPFGTSVAQCIALERTLWKNSSYAWLGMVYDSYGTKKSSSHLLPISCMGSADISSAGVQVSANDGTSNYLAVQRATHGSTGETYLNPVSSNGAGSLTASLVLFGDFFSLDREGDSLCKKILASSRLRDYDPFSTMFYGSSFSSAVLAGQAFGLDNGKIVIDLQGKTQSISTGIPAGINIVNCLVGVAGKLKNGVTYRFRTNVESYNPSYYVDNSNLTLYEASSTGTFVGGGVVCSLGLSSSDSATFTARSDCNYIAAIDVYSAFEVPHYGIQPFSMTGTIDLWIEEVI